MGRKSKQGTSYLRLLREERGISLTEMVGLVGYTKGYISAVETGVSKPTSAFLHAYERALGLDEGSLAASAEQAISQVLTTAQAGLMPEPPKLDPALLPVANKGAVLEGVQSILLQAIAMVTAAAKQSPWPGAEIVVTFQSEHDPLTVFPELAVPWRAALRQALHAGWNVVHLWRLRIENQHRFELIARMLSILGYRGKYQPYLFPNHVLPGAPADVIIVPGQGALWLFGSRQSRHVDSGFFFPPDSPHYPLISQFATTMRSQTQPLLEVYPERSLDFKALALQFEVEDGAQLLLKEGLSFQSMPIAIRSACIQRILQAPLVRSLQEQTHLELWCQQLLDHHRQRVHLFEQFLQDRQHEARHVVTKTAILRLLSHGELPADDWLRDQPQSQLTVAEALAWLRHVIWLLQVYPNYQLAIVDAIDPAYFPVAWKVEGRQTLILESWQAADTEDGRENVNIIIHDRTIAQSFREHFFNYWERLSNRERNKDCVIDWLQSQVMQPVKL